MDTAGTALGLAAADFEELVLEAALLEAKGLVLGAALRDVEGIELAAGPTQHRMEKENRSPRTTLAA